MALQPRQLLRNIRAVGEIDHLLQQPLVLGAGRLQAGALDALDELLAIPFRDGGRVLLNLGRCSASAQSACRCGHTHPDNRATQAEFICQDCGFTANADHNAALVIKKRGIKALLEGTIVVKQKKTVRVRKGSRPQIGQGLPESKRASMEVGSIMGGPVVHGQETTVRRTVGIPPSALVSENREAPTLTVSCG